MKKVIPSEVIQISLSNLSTSDVVQTPPQLECRFCKQNENPQNSPNSFLIPCSCLQPIHSYCLADQMQKNMRGQIITTKPEKRYTCLKCQKNIRFLLQATHQCRSRRELRDFASKNKCFCFWLVVCTVVMLSLLGVVVVIKVAQLKIDGPAITSNVVIAISIIVIVLFLLSSFFCLTSVLFQERRKVSLVTSHNKQRRKFSSRIEIIDC